MAAERQKIPNSVIAVVADVLGDHYFNPTRLNVLFAGAGAPGNPPEGNIPPSEFEQIYHGGYETPARNLSVPYRPPRTIMAAKSSHSPPADPGHATVSGHPGAVHTVTLARDLKSSES